MKKRLWRVARRDGRAVLLTLISDVKLDDDEEAATPLSLTVDPAAAVAMIRELLSPLPPLLFALLAFISLVIILFTALELLFVSRNSSARLGS